MCLFSGGMMIMVMMTMPESGSVFGGGHAMTCLHQRIMKTSKNSAIAEHRTQLDKNSIDRDRLTD